VETPPSAQRLPQTLRVEMHPQQEIAVLLLRNAAEAQFPPQAVADAAAGEPVAHRLLRSTKR
jgi:hypothetical protein